MGVTNQTIVEERQRKFRLLSYNVQVGINSNQPHHYVTRSLRHFFPSKKRFSTLDRIANTISGYDFVALQELDAGSYRTGNINLTEYLSEKAGYHHWHHQLNRNLGQLAQHGNGFLTHSKPAKVLEHQLPGLIPGRGGLEVHLGEGGEKLVIIMLHLALGGRSRGLQLDFITEVINRHKYVVLMGDLNTEPHSKEMEKLFSNTHLKIAEKELKTFPSWRPEKHIDHILVSEGLDVRGCHVLSEVNSDHLPVEMEISLPDLVNVAF